MILPTKRLPLDKSLLGVGARILSTLDRPKTVSRIWDDLSKTADLSGKSRRLSYDWFVLGLDLLYSTGAIEERAGVLRKVQP
jgi:hypothetical protein